MSANLQPLPPSHSADSDAQIIAQLKAELPEPLFTMVSRRFSELEYARLKIQVLEEHLRLRRIARYGPGSETLSNLQLQLLEEEPGVTSEDVQAESEREGLPAPDGNRKQQRRRHPGRQTLPADLPRVEKIMACTAEQCVCGSCGQATTVLGYDESEVLNVRPAEYYVEVIRREKRACRQCEEQGVAMAPLPARIIDKSLVSDQIILDTILNKYTAHLPLYRQSALLERDCGIEITRATMCGWVMTVGELLSPVVGAMRRELLASGYIQADETPVDVQTHDQRGRNHQGYLWQYGTPGSGAVFDFRMSRGREGPKQFLGDFEGILQTDDYIAYERGLGGPGMAHASCWSHARRHFVDAVKLNKQDAGSIRAVDLMDKLFLIDAQAREENMDHAARHLLRQEKAPPLLDQIREHILTTGKTVLPRSKAGQACNYTLTLWKKLTLFLAYPQLELSTNVAENSMRPIATGRKNWIHIGSPQAGPRVAAILSVIESCRRLAIPVRKYLLAVLPGLADTPIPRVAQLTPSAWAAKTQD